MGDLVRTVPFNLLDGVFHNVDRRPDTWSVQVEARVAGRIDDDRLRAAVATAAGLHPMARARLQHHEWSATTTSWEIPDELDHLPVTVVEAADDADVDRARVRLQSVQVPLTMSPAFLVYLVHHPDGDWLMLNVNHVMGDGLSTFRILTSIVRAYAGQDDPVPDVDPLEVRDLRALTGGGIKERIEHIKLLLEHLGRSATPPTRVAARGVDGRPDDRPGYGFVMLPLTAEETARVMARRQKPATVNDLLLAGLVLAVRRWNEANDAKVGRTSVLMPVNLRPQEWWFEVVSNFSSWVSVPVALKEQTTLEETAQAVQRQTAELKEAGASGVLVDLLDVPKYLPAGLKARLKDVFPFFARNLAETTVLSNLGRLAEAPDLGDAGTVTDLYFSPPAPLPVGLSCGAASMGDRLFLTLRYRRAHLDDDAAREIADLYRGVLLD